MPGVCRWFVILFLLGLSAQPLCAVSAREQRAFNLAANAFSIASWERAEREFGEFAQKFPESTLRAQAIFFQAHARFQLGQYEGVIELLSANQAAAGDWLDQYLNQLAEAYFQIANYRAAADTFSRLAALFPTSSLRLKASVDETAARAKLGEWPRIIGLLHDPDGVFQQLAAANPTNELTARGYLQLGEAQFVVNDFAAAAATVRSFAQPALRPELEWQRWHLQCRLDLAQGRVEEALENATNLVALAAAASQPALKAGTVAFQAGILERLRRFAAAAATYQQNLAENIPVERQRHAMWKIAQLSLEQGNTSEAIQILEKFMSQHTNSPAVDMALLTLGELKLKQYIADPATNSTNVPALDSPGSELLRQALAHCDAVRTRFPQSELAGKALLTKGWCLLTGEKLEESREAFRLAIGNLPLSEDQAVARFKLADAQLALGDPAAATANYQWIIEHCGSVPGVKEDLLELALYQAVRAALDAANFDAATNALEKILDWYPDGFAGDRALLLAGQGLLRQKDPAKARELFSGFEQRYPDSGLLPEVRLAIARTYEQEQNWTAAITNLDAWVNSYATHTNLPRALCNRAWIYFMAGQETNALPLFTNLIAGFPANELAPRAQWWVGDYFFRQNDFQNAEAGYQLVYKNWPASELSYQAQIMAGGAAMARHRPSDAIQYFTNLTSNPNCPADIKASALFAYGDALVSLDPAGTPGESNRWVNLDQAIGVFKTIVDLYPAIDLVPRAWGRIGDCCKELGADDPQRYEQAIQAYQRAIGLSNATVSVRSQARIGLGIVAEKQAQLKSDPGDARSLHQAALDACLDVFHGKVLHAGEQADPFWVKRAAFDAARIADENLKDPQQAVRILEDLKRRFPVLRSAVDKRILRVQEHAREKS